MSQVASNRLSNIVPENSRLIKVYKVSGIASLTLGTLFLITAIGFIISITWNGSYTSWFSSWQNNWLIVIFNLHAGFISTHDNPLLGLKLLDIAILVIFSLLCFGLFTVLRKNNKTWSSIAFILSLVTIILFIVTQNAGRSTVMLSVMIFSFIMLRNMVFSKVTIYAGILAGVFLFVGDLSVGIHSDIITILFGIGYVLLTIWFFLIGRTLLWFGCPKKE